MFNRLVGLLAALLVGVLWAGVAAAFTLTSDEERRFVEHDGIRGLEILIYVPRNRLLLCSHVYVVRQRQYAISYVGADGTENSGNVENFLYFFHVRQ